MIPILSVVGKSGSGKTTLIEKLIPSLRVQHYRVAVVKHHAHITPIDVPGKDSWRFAEAGASAVFVSSPAELVRFERVKHESKLDEITAHIEDADLILTEGFSRENSPKIEVSRLACGTDLIGRPDEVLAIVSDYAIQTDTPHFDLNDVEGLTSFIVRRLLHSQAAVVT